jgi:cellulose synthase/poly-beta-1,6-N-acetylglucosamine synthase-like glycosyltransferase
VVVPVRDEERNIAPCLDALGRSDYPRLRIRVVDDGSTDRTSAILAEAARHDPRIDVRTAGELPDGWLGKSHALWSGTRDAREDWLLFLDADVRLTPSCIDRAVAAATRRNADLLTVVPEIRVMTFWETTVQAIIAYSVLLWLDAGAINDGNRSRAAAMGPFMLFRRAAYEQIGGHRRVHAEIAEDLRLAEATKAAGKRLVLVRGTQIAAIRMYDSLGAIVAGWSKNFHVALEGKLWLAPFAASALLFFYAAPETLPLVALARADHLGAGLALCAAALSLAARIDGERLYGLPARGWSLAPLGGVVAAWILLRSVLRAAFGAPSTWKGRSVRPALRRGA